ncbi:hypothetical protein ACO1MR_13920 [Staphylococcus aureus]
MLKLYYKINFATEPLLLNLLDENKTMIVVTHDLDLAKRFDVIVNISELRN